MGTVHTVSIDFFVQRRARTTGGLPGVPIAGALHALRRLQSGAAVVVDAAVLAVVAVAAVLGRTRIGGFQRDTRFFDTAFTVVPVIVLVWLVALAVAGTYAPLRMTVGTSEFSRVATTSTVVAGLVGIYCYLAKFELSRGFFLLMFAIGTPLLVVGRFALRRAIQHLHQNGRWRVRVVIAGIHPHIDDVAEVLHREAWLGYEVVGALTPSHLEPGATVSTLGSLGRTDAVVEVLREAGADAVVFTEGAFPSSAEFRRMAWELEEADVQMIVVPSVSDISAERLDVRPVGGLPLVYVGRPRSTTASRRLKRAFDVLGSVAGLLLMSPVFLVVAAAIWLDDHGPIFFRQVRLGRDGRPFSCVKFRSMVRDAEALLPSIAHLDVGSGVLFKSDADPRITRPGRFIRRFSVDELPQLVNVLRGEMSLVGPRPPLPREVLGYADREHRRLRVRPGMTGLWQVSGRSDLSWQETVRLDLYYVDNWSMLQDLQILVRTVRAVLGGRGAY